MGQSGVLYKNVDHLNVNLSDKSYQPNHYVLELALMSNHPHDKLPQCPHLVF